MKSPRLYLCEGFCALLGPVRDMVLACGFGDARMKFYMKHKLQATHVALER